MRSIKKFIALIVCFTLLFSTTLPVLAEDNGTCSLDGQCNSEEESLDNGDYYFLVENGNIYIIPSIETRMGGGIGRCSVENKTFSYSMTRSQAQSALDVITIGEGSIKSLGTLLSLLVPSGVGLATSLILNYLGGESTYVSCLKAFLNSGKSIAYLKFETHCVNRGYMYGDPMYDYVVDSVSIDY